MVRGELSLIADGQRWRFALDAGGERRELWYERLDQRLGDAGRLDVGLAGSIMSWHLRGVDELHIHGPVSRTLLRNLDELQRVWTKWRPGRYRHVALLADEVIDDVPEGSGAVAAFSGGVDATFAVWQHTIATPSVASIPLHDAVMVHGFDILYDRDDDVFAAAVSRGEKMLASTGVPLAQVKTNFRTIGLKWVDSFGVGIGSVLLLWQDSRRIGLIGSSEDYGAFLRPWGSTPVQDWMTSTGSMEIRHEGGGYSRTEKVAALLNWPEAMQHLRVCWQGPSLDRNCGTCEKCVRTILNIRAVGGSLPQCFDRDVSVSRVARVAMPTPRIVMENMSILQAARANGMGSEPWVRALSSSVARGRVKFAIGRPAKRLISRSKGAVER